MINNDQKPIVGAILIVGFLIAGAILLKGNSTSTPKNENNGIPVNTTTLSPVGALDKTLGNSNAKVTVIMYADFQCPFCAAVSGLLPANSPLIQSLKQRDPNWTPSTSGIIDNYVKNGKVLFVYRDWAFLGPESIKAAEAARCAGDQGKFWEYHDYLYSHQNGENEGNFSDTHLKSFAKELGLDVSSFDKCLDSNKYTQAVNDSKNDGSAAGVNGTPKGFILKDGKLVGMIEGAEPFSSVKSKIDAALK
ncbi:MAG: thioredoxin domain-containing protein [Candidatus Paceibacterota bacterium]